MPTCRKMKVDSYLSPWIKLKSKWIKDFSINPVTLNLIEEKVGSILEHMDTGDHFLNIIPVAQTLKATINKWDILILRSYWKVKDTVNKTKQQSIEWEKILTNPTSDRGLISKIHKKCKKPDIKIPNNPIKKWGTHLNREFSTEESQMAKTHLRNCSTSLAMREMQIKISLRYHLTSIRMAKIKNTNNSLCWRECRVRGTHLHCWWGSVNLYRHFGNHMAVSQKEINLPQDPAIPLLGT